MATRATHRKLPSLGSPNAQVSAMEPAPTRTNQGTIGKIGEPWCWNMNPNIYPENHPVM
jgi:hypothetical protein